jgi:hypothetical protein
MDIPHWLSLLVNSSGLFLCFFTHLYIIMIIQYI